MRKKVLGVAVATILAAVGVSTSVEAITLSEARANCSGNFTVTNFSSTTKEYSYTCDGVYGLATEDSPSSSSGSNSSSSGSSSSSSNSGSSSSSSGSSSTGSNADRYRASGNSSSNSNCVDTTFWGNNVCGDAEGSGIFKILNTGLNILTWGVGIAATIGIIVCGIMYMTARDNEAQMTKAKNRIVQIVIGLAIYAMMWALLNFLLPGGVFGNNA